MTATQIRAVGSALPRQRTAPPDPGPGPGSRPVSRRRRWAAGYARAVAATDGVIVVAVCIGGTLLSFGSAGPETPVGPTAVSYRLLAVLLAGVWLALIGGYGAWDQRVLGAGTSEYKRLAHAGLMVFGLLAVVSYLGRIQVARGYLAAVVPIGLVALLVSRALWRGWLHRRRKAGHLLVRVLLVGAASTAAECGRHLARGASGYVVVGLCVPDAAPAASGDFPVLGSTSELAAAIDRAGADVVVLTPTSGLSAADIRRLAWDLEPTEIRLMVAPGVDEMSGPRVTIKPVNGVPLLQMRAPRFRGIPLVVKTAMDVVGAAVLLTLTAPVWVVVAAAVKLSDGGPVFFRQTRVGKAGREFRMIKFRSMVQHADSAFETARKASGQQSSVFYKSAADSRITPVGRILRRTSLDELPQLFNVLAGQMSLIGPRPLVPGEGAEIERFLERRVLVKPGLTGLWQVSGRSDLTPAERVRLDFYYVENWSVAGDIAILVKTLRTVAARSGAY